MRWPVVILLAMAVGCASTPQPVAQRTLPDSTFESEIPPEPERPARISTIPVEQCVVGEGEEAEETGPGILFSDESAAYVGRLRIGYDELRRLYIIDSRTRERERQIYERALSNADEEIQRQAQRAERTWWEQHGGVVGLVSGIVVGVAATIGVLAATEEVRSGP